MKPYEFINSRGTKYYLNTGNKKGLFFFTKNIRSTATELPQGYVVVESPKTALPFVKKG